jgi:hypothetical protein
MESCEPAVWGVHNALNFLDARRQEAVLINDAMFVCKLAYRSSVFYMRRGPAQQASAAFDARLSHPQEAAPFLFISFPSCQRIR